MVHAKSPSKRTLDRSHTKRNSTLHVEGPLRDDHQVSVPTELVLGSISTHPSTHPFQTKRCRAIGLLRCTPTARYLKIPQYRIKKRRHSIWKAPRTTSPCSPSRRRCLASEGYHTPNRNKLLYILPHIGLNNEPFSDDLQYSKGGPQRSRNLISGHMPDFTQPSKRDATRAPGPGVQSGKTHAFGTALSSTLRDTIKLNESEPRLSTPSRTDVASHRRTSLPHAGPPSDSPVRPPPQPSLPQRQHSRALFDSLILRNIRPPSPRPPAAAQRLSAQVAYQLRMASHRHTGRGFSRKTASKVVRACESIGGEGVGEHGEPVFRPYILHFAIGYSFQPIITCLLFVYL